MKHLIYDDSNGEGQYEGVSFIPAQAQKSLFIALPNSSESHIVIMHFNEEISLQFKRNEQVTDEFIDKALQEMQLINLKRTMKPNNLEASVKPAASNTIIARK